MANLLILEDEVAFGFQLKNDLETAGHEVEVRYSATDAIEELTRTSYDLLISDIIIRKDGRSVPDGGIKLVGWVRSHSEFRELPIIAITGSYKYPGLQHILTTAEQVGANAGLEKPFSIQEILALIDRLTEANSNDLREMARGQMDG